MMIGHNGKEYKWAIYQNKNGTFTLDVLPFLIILNLGVLLVFTTHFSWTGVLVCIASYYVRMFGVTGVYHRYFSHKTYKMGRVTQFFMALLGATANQKGPLWWGVTHRHHHAYSDKPEDLHSPKKGFWHSHMFWFLTEESLDVDYKKIGDFAKYPELRFLDRFWYLPPTAYALALYFIGGWHIVVWGFFVSTFFLQNGTFTINSLSHLFGNQRYYTGGDTSRNNWFLAILTLGEGWHNNHHKYGAAARNGFYWYEYDITYYILKLMSFVGLTWDLKPVPERVLAEGRENDRLSRQARKNGLKFIPRPRSSQSSHKKTGLEKTTLLPTPASGL